MNKKAFTLVELLATIIILGLLATIVAVNVADYVDEARASSYDTLVKSIKSGTELYLADHSSEYMELDVVGATFEIELADLASDKYIENKLIDERTGDTIALTTKVKITVVGKNKIVVQFPAE